MRFIPRIFYPDNLNTSSIVEINEQETIHYLTNVLRLKLANTVKLFNPDNGEFTAKIIDISRKSIQLLIEEQTHPSLVNPRASKILLFSILKKNALNFMLEKLTEIGIDIFQPIIMENSALNELNQAKAENILINAAQQCERLDIPQIKKPIKFSQLNEFYPQQHIICALERDEKNSATVNFTQHDDWTLLVGPEGGFSNDERQYIYKSDNIQTLSLGKNILRAETAAIALAAKIYL
jgi:16S rRNA (uracil1498-N3)-methyltransferase